MYIALEGIDTAGKSTQISRLQEYFEDAVLTKEPGGTRPGRKIRELVLSGQMRSKKGEFLLFLADRAEHIQEIVLPNRSKTILSDRSAVSGVAYALVAGDITKEELVRLNHFATDGIYPDIVFLLRLTPNELKKRLFEKELDGIEQRGTAYLLEIQDAIEEAAKLLGIKLVTIDATQTIEEITKEILSYVKK